jgi:hypothetical protein
MTAVAHHVVRELDAMTAGRRSAVVRDRNAVLIAHLHVEMIVASVVMIEIEIDLLHAESTVAIAREAVGMTAEHDLVRIAKGGQKRSAAVAAREARAANVMIAEALWRGTGHHAKKERVKKGRVKKSESVMVHVTEMIVGDP